jgi:hypothetical protein
VGSIYLSSIIPCLGFLVSIILWKYILPSTYQRLKRSWPLVLNLFPKNNRYWNRQNGYYWT